MGTIRVEFEKNEDNVIIDFSVSAFSIDTVLEYAEKFYSDYNIISIKEV